MTEQERDNIQSALAKAAFGQSQAAEAIRRAEIAHAYLVDCQMLLQRALRYQAVVKD